MMALFNACFLFGIVLVGYAIFTAVVIATLGLFRARRRRGFFISTVVAYAVLVGGYFTYATRPAAQFQRAFGFAPPADVTDLRSSQWILGDSGQVYLAFRASPETIARITAGRYSPGGVPVVTGSDPPAWWTSALSPTVHSRRVTGGSFANEEEWLGYDPASGEAFYRFVGID